MVIRVGRPKTFQTEHEKHVHGEVPSLLVELANCASSVQRAGMSREITSPRSRPGITGTGLTSHHDLLSAMKGAPIRSVDSQKLTR